jgi:DNA polymerase III subunit delta
MLGSMASRPPVYLLVGSEELLLRRAADQLLDELRAEAGELDVIDLRAADVREQGLPDLRTGSLFGTPRAVVVREAQELPAEASATLLEQIERPLGEATVILLASGTGRIQKLAKAAKAHGGRVDVEPPRDWEADKWARLVTDELRRLGRTAEPAAVKALLDHAGLSVAAIAEKTAQAAAATPPGKITAEQVEAAVIGRGSRGSFAVADAMLARNPTEALRLLRGVLEGGDEPLAVLGALTYRLRALVAVAGGTVKEAGLKVSAGQAGHLKRTRGNFGPGEMTRAYRALADADLQLKSGDLPPAFVLERAVVAIATRA